MPYDNLYNSIGGDSSPMFLTSHFGPGININPYLNYLDRKHRVSGPTTEQPKDVKELPIEGLPSQVNAKQQDITNAINEHAKLLAGYGWKQDIARNDPNYNSILQRMNPTSGEVNEYKQNLEQYKLDQKKVSDTQSESNIDTEYIERKGGNLSNVVDHPEYINPNNPNNLLIGKRQNEKYATNYNNDYNFNQVHGSSKNLQEGLNTMLSAANIGDIQNSFTAPGGGKPLKELVRKGIDNNVFTFLDNETHNRETNAEGLNAMRESFIKALPPEAQVGFKDQMYKDAALNKPINVRTGKSSYQQIPFGDLVKTVGNDKAQDLYAADLFNTEFKRRLVNKSTDEYKLQEITDQLKEAKKSQEATPETNIEEAMTVPLETNQPKLDEKGHFQYDNQGNIVYNKTAMFSHKQNMPFISSVSDFGYRLNAEGKPVQNSKLNAQEIQVNFMGIPDVKQEQMQKIIDDKGKGNPVNPSDLFNVLYIGGNLIKTSDLKFTDTDNPYGSGIINVGKDAFQANRPENINQRTFNEDITKEKSPLSKKTQSGVHDTFLEHTLQIGKGDWDHVSIPLPDDNGKVKDYTIKEIANDQKLLTKANATKTGYNFAWADDNVKIKVYAPMMNNNIISKEYHKGITQAVQSSLK